MGATTWPARPVWHPDDRLFGKVTPGPSHTVEQQPLQPSSIAMAARTGAVPIALDRPCMTRVLPANSSLHSAPDVSSPSVHQPCPDPPPPVPPALRLHPIPAHLAHAPSHKRAPRCPPPSDPTGDGIAGDGRAARPQMVPPGHGQPVAGSAAVEVRARCEVRARGSRRRLHRGPRAAGPRRWR
jgi:hypothetical protein